MKKKKGKPQINNLNSHLKNLEKKWNNPQASRMKEIIKIRAVIDEIENRKEKKIEEKNNEKTVSLQRSIKLTNS